MNVFSPAFKAPQESYTQIPYTLAKRNGNKLIGALVKAAVYTTYGPPDVLQIEEVERPVPGADEVLIRIAATTVNRTDCGFLRGSPFLARFFFGFPKPRHTILGSEFAGTVVEIGSNVTSLKEDDRVFGFSEFGAHAEYIVMPATGSLATIPDNMSFEEVAPGTEGVHYALNNLRAVDIQNGQQVLINGATGAIGSAALQLCKYYGTFVTAVCNTKNVELVKSLGADRIYDYTKEDFTEDDLTYDVVFDAVGKSSFFSCRHLLKPDGIYFSTELGYLWQNPWLALWTAKFSRKKVKFPIPTHNQNVINFLKELMESGKFKPVIDRTYPLEDIAEAYRYVEAGQKTGNVVITVGTHNGV